MPTVPVILDFTLTQGGFSLELHQRIEARTVALFGPSGAGKTTTLDAIAGLRRPARGEIRIGTHALFASEGGVDLPAHARRVGYVPQDVALFPHLNVRRNIMYGAGRNGETLPTTVLELLELDGLLSRRIDGLSGGERQRVALARALMSGPDLLLLDEPLAALDLGLRDRILPYLERVRDEIGTPMIYVSHIAAEVQRIADWVVVLDGGRVVRSGPPGDALPAAARAARSPLAEADP